MTIQIIILFLQIIFLRKILKFFIVSPSYLYIVFSIVSIISSIIYFYFFDNKFSLYNLDKVNEFEFINIIKLYLIALNSFIFGILIFHNFSKRKTRNLFKYSLTEYLFFTYDLPKNTLKIVNTMFAIILLFFSITYGKELFVRQDYLPEMNNGLVVLIKIFSFIEVMFLGIIYYRYKKHSIILFTILILLTIGTGSRVVFLFLVVYFILIFISKGNTLKNKFLFLFNLVLSFIFLAYLMQFRKEDSHGIVPYLQSIFSTESNDPIRNFYFNIYYSFIFGVYVTIGTIKEAIPSWKLIFISLNPLPGSMVGWYTYADKMRLNIYTPFSLHGRIFVMGLPFTILYFFLTGLIFSFIERFVRLFLKSGKKEIALILVILLILHIIYGFEYNLRSAFRYFYYALFLIILTFLYPIIKSNLPKKKT